MLFMITCFKLCYVIFLLDINNPLTTIFLISFGGGFKDRLLDFLEKPPDPDEGAKWVSKTCGRIDSEFGVQVTMKTHNLYFYNPYFEGVKPSFFMVLGSKGMHYTWICLICWCFFLSSMANHHIFHHHLVHYFFSELVPSAWKTTKSKKGQYWISQPKTCWRPGRDPKPVFRSFRSSKWFGSHKLVRPKKVTAFRRIARGILGFSQFILNLEDHLPGLVSS